MYVNYTISSSNHTNVTSTRVVVDKDEYCENDYIIHYLNSTVPLLWLILGTITNALSLLVFLRRSMRRNSTFFYLAVLSFSDMIVLWTSAFRDFLAYRFQIYISGILPCKLHVFVFFTVAQFSSWTLVGANLDRLVSVTSIQKAKIWCTRRTAMKYSIVLFILLCIVNAHFLMFLESTTTTPLPNLSAISTVHPYVYPKCTLKSFEWYVYFYNNVYLWIDSCLYCTVPFLIMIVSNTILIKRVFATKNNLFMKPMSLKSNTNKIKNMSKSFFSTNKSPQPSNNAKNKTQENDTSVYRAASMKKRRNRDKDSIDRMRNMAITVIGVTVIFVVLTVPINIYVPITLATDKHDSKCQDLLFSILNNIVNANHAINFFIYLTTNSKFKKEFKILLWLMIKKLTNFFNIHIDYLESKGLTVLSNSTALTLNSNNHGKFTYTSKIERNKKQTVSIQMNN